MEFKIRNKNKLKTDYIDELEAYMVGLLFALIYLLISSFVIANSPLRQFINNNASIISVFIIIIMTLICICLLTSVSSIIIYKFINQYKAKHYPENISEKIKDSLNTPYVDKKDKEKVYLLHELIKKYGIEHSKNNQHDHFYLELDLKDNDQYDKIDYNQYDDDQKDVIYDLIKHKKLTENEAIQFFDQYISDYSYPKIRSIEERNELKQRIINKNM